MSAMNPAPAKASRPAPSRRSGVPGAKAIIQFATAACAAVGVGLAAPASAAPAQLNAQVAESPDAAFLQALDQIGVGHPNNGQALATANSVCQRLGDGFSAAETEEGLVKANPGLEPLHATAFVKAARTVYCPGAAVGVLPGYPGQA